MLGRVWGGVCEAQKFADENNLLFVETSAKNGTNVEAAFVSAAKKIHEKVLCNILNPSDVESGVQLHTTTLPSTKKPGGKASTDNKSGCDKC